MKNTFSVTVSREKEMFLFKVAEYFDPKEQHTKFEVFLGGRQVVSFEPDRDQATWKCVNTGKLEDELIYLLLDKLEAYC